MKFDLRTVGLVMRAIHWKEFFLSLYLIKPLGSLIVLHPIIMIQYMY